MTDTRRALCWFLVVALCTVIALIVTAEPGTPLEPTPTTWFSGPGDLTEVHP